MCTLYNIIFSLIYLRLNLRINYNFKNWGTTDDTHNAYILKMSSKLGKYYKEETRHDAQLNNTVPSVPIPLYFINTILQQLF